MNQSKKLAKKDKIFIIDWLAEHYPNAFFKKHNQIKPLKLGIYEDVLDFYERLDTHIFSKSDLKEALNFYSASPAYLSSQKENAARIDLFGNEVDVVTKEQADYAKSKYESRYTKPE